MTTVLIADDSSARRRIMSSVLEAAGFEVVSAENGVEAVQAVFRFRPDVVVLDVQMPRLSGYVVTRLLKDDFETAGIPVITITGQDVAADRYWIEETGADRFLAKDFGANELVEAVREVLAAAGDARGQPPVPREPIELDDDDVLARVAELLDRKLFEAKVTAEVTQIAADVSGFEETIAAVLHLLGRIVDYDLAAVFLLDTRLTYLTVANECSHRQYREFCRSIADSATNLAGQPVMVSDLVPRVADAQGLLGAEEEDGLVTFLSLPLRARGRVLGCLALSSATENAFGDAARDTLRLIDRPIAVVISSAQLAAAPTATDVA